MRKHIFLAVLAGLVALAPTHACDLGDIVTKGSTSRSVSLDIIDSTDGTPETGVVFNTSGIALWYQREAAAVTDITEATLAALTTAYSSGGFLAKRDGSYRLDVPDAAFATGANWVDIGGTVTGMVVICQRVRLVDYSLEDGVRMGLTGLANAVPGAAGGLLIAGTNADFDVTANASFSGGVNITQSSANTAALVVTGNGTGNGATITSGSGATGTGLAVVSAATNGTAATFAGVGTGNGITSTGGATGHGVAAVGGATSGSGLRAVATTSGNGIIATGVGTTQAGIAATGGSTSSAGISATGGGTGAGILATAGATGIGVSAVGGGTSGAGLSATSTSGNGITATGGTAGHGIAATGGATGHGANFVGGATSGNGMRAAGTSGNSDAMNLVGQGSANGLLATGGATGNGFSLVGGATSGNALQTAYTAPLGPQKQFGILESGNMQASTSTTAVLRTATSFADTYLEGATVVLTGGTGAGQRRTCSAWTNTTPADTCTVTAWATTPDTTTTYEVWGTASSTGGGGGLDAAATRAALGLATANLDTQLSAIDDVVDTEVAAIKTKTDFLPSATAGAAGGVFIAGTNAATTITTGLTTTFTGNLSGNVTGSVGSVTGAVGSVTGNVGGNVTGSVGTVNALAANALTAAATAADFSTEINTGMATQASIDTIDDFLDTEIGSILTATSAASIRAAIGLGAANLDTQVDALPTNAELSAALGTADDAVLAALSSLPNSIRDIQVEDQGGGVTSACVQSILLSFAAGDIVTTGGSTVWKDPSNAETRITSTITSNGNRTATITCPTL